MTELDQVWSQMLAEAGQNADALGRRHIADYLRLKATNDAIRARGVGWLLDTFIEIAADEQRRRRNIVIEREDPYSFARGSSRMQGTLLSIRQGVRCLTIEAGWARTPRDGVMVKGALAYACISHFGMPRETADIRLVHDGSLPTWLDDSDAIVDTAALQSHVRLFLGA